MSARDGRAALIRRAACNLRAAVRLQVVPCPPRLYLVFDYMDFDLKQCGVRARSLPCARTHEPLPHLMSCDDSLSTAKPHPALSPTPALPTPPRSISPQPLPSRRGACVSAVPLHRGPRLAGLDKEFKKGMPAKLIQSCMYQILDGLAFCHARVSFGTHARQRESAAGGPWGGYWLLVVRDLLVAASAFTFPVVAVPCLRSSCCTATSSHRMCSLTCTAASNWPILGSHARSSQSARTPRKS